MTGGLRRLVSRIGDVLRIGRANRRREEPATVEEMLPRPGIFSVGNGDFRAIGLGILEELRQCCGLAPHHCVLDIGCGIGRVAIPLTQYLSAEGSYEGFDPVGKAIHHCQTRITPSYPNFKFQAADLYNKRYNARGRVRDYEYRFPYPDASFDLAFAVSVFTHLLPEGAERYIAEAARVLKPGGHFFATYFLLNHDSVAALADGRIAISFDCRFADHRVHKRRNPEAAVAYEEAFVTGLYEKHGLALEQPPAYGLWSGRAATGHGGHQDRLVATRRAGTEALR